MSQLKQNSFVTQCSEDEEGNLLFEIPDEFMDALGWKEGTVLDIEIVGDSIMLREAGKPKSIVEESPAPRRRKSPTKRGAKAKDPV